MSRRDETDCVVLVRKRDAKTDRPDDDRIVLTNYGYARWNHNWGVNSEGRWTTVPNGLRSTRFVEPSVWYDLRPTEGKGLTVEHLEAVSGLATRKWTTDAQREGSARLRAAIDALTTKDDDA